MRQWWIWGSQFSKALATVGLTGALLGAGIFLPGPGWAGSEAPEKPPGAAGEKTEKPPATGLDTKKQGISENDKEKKPATTPKKKTKTGPQGEFGGYPMRK